MLARTGPSLPRHKMSAAEGAEEASAGDVVTDDAVAFSDDTTLKDTLCMEQSVPASQSQLSLPDHETDQLRNASLVANDPSPATGKQTPALHATNVANEKSDLDMRFDGFYWSRRNAACHISEWEMS